ncbi:MAG: hypothetical protein DDT20_00876 [Firmicutes bacterium]|nr:hypothetical protein [Bacillota bacterium]MBT9176556.1 hypothetical protein [Bacillota bacterium]
MKTKIQYQSYSPSYSPIEGVKGAITSFWADDDEAAKKAAEERHSPLSYSVLLRVDTGKRWILLAGKKGKGWQEKKDEYNKHGKKKEVN